MYSFSQNFEDVYIRRAFSGIVDGFYIDAGAFDPVVDSVTKMLYDLGWSGINLEPGPSFPSFSCRTRDINLPFALSAQEGMTVFHYHAADPGTSTTALSNKSSAPTVQSYEVVATTLASIIRDHAPRRHIHFIKLDIEGSEWEILQSTNWREIRPELIIVESSKPYTNIRRDDGWTEHMNSFDYEEVFFDGINTYYLRKESLFRRNAFEFPVNVLDGVRKFDPQQHHMLQEPESLAAMRKISDDIVGAIEASGAHVGAYIEGEMNNNLRIERDRVAELSLERSRWTATLHAVARDLDRRAATPPGVGRGDSPDEVIDHIASGIAALVEERDRADAAARDAQAQVERHKTALEEQGRQASTAIAEARVLAKRLSMARASRASLIEVTERLTAMRLSGSGTAHGSAVTNAPVRDVALDFELVDAPGPLATQLAAAQNLPAWQRLFPLGIRALVRRANALRDGSQWSDAALAFARACALRPNRADLLLQKANMLTELRAFALAELAYREALAKDAANGLIYLHFGHMLEMSERPSRAHAAYLKARELLPDQPAIADALKRVEKLTDWLPSGSTQ